MSDDIISELRAKALRARLLFDLLNQDQWWVPQAGWGKLGQVSLKGARLTECDQAGEPSGAVHTYRWVSLNLDALDEGAGEKVQVAAMEPSWRFNVVQFCARRAAGMASGLYWEPALVSTSLGNCDEFDLIDEAMLNRTTDEKARTEWFESLPLIRALRGANIAERDARISAGPVLLGAQPSGEVPELVLP